MPKKKKGKLYVLKTPLMKKFLVERKMNTFEDAFKKKPRKGANHLEEESIFVRDHSVLAMVRCLRHMIDNLENLSLDDAYAAMQVVRQKRSWAKKKWDIPNGIPMQEIEERFADHLKEAYELLGGDVDDDLDFDPDDDFDFDDDD